MIAPMDWSSAPAKPDGMSAPTTASSSTTARRCGASIATRACRSSSGAGAAKDRMRPLVLICDISGSMDRYSRLLLQFVHALEHGLDTVEVFVFGTRLTRITRELRKRDVDAAIEARREIGRRLVGWHAHRRGDQDVQLQMEPSGAALRRDRDDDLGRMGPRRSCFAVPRDGAVAAIVPAIDLVESAAWCARIPTVDAGHSRRAAIC